MARVGAHDRRERYADPVERLSVFLRRKTEHDPAAHQMAVGRKGRRAELEDTILQDAAARTLKVVACICLRELIVRHLEIGIPTRALLLNAWRSDARCFLVHCCRLPWPVMARASDLRSAIEPSAI